MELITIVVPAFNAAPWIAECLDSILAQSFDDWQAIIVDDGSTDATADIAAEYALRDKRIRLMSRPNGGPSAARNTALDAVCTEYVTFVDADDILHPEALQRLMDLADSHPDISAVACWYTTHHFDTSKSLPEARPRILSAHDAIIATLRRRPYHEPMSCAKAFRTNLFDGLRYTEGRRYEDLDIFYKLYWRAGAIVHDTAPIYFYRQHTASFVHRWDSHRADVLNVTDDIVTWSKGLGDAKLVNAAMDRRLSARFNILVTAARTLRAAQRDAIPTDTDPTQAATAYDVAALQATMARCRKDIAADRRRALWDIHTRLRNRLALLVPTGILCRL